MATRTQAFKARVAAHKALLHTRASWVEILFIKVYKRIKFGFQLLKDMSKTQLIESWKKRLREIQHTQYEASKTLMKYHYWLGVPSVILATVVSSAIFLSIQKQGINEAVKLGFGLVSAVSTILIGLQTFFKYNERAEKHRTYGSKAGSLRRQLEQYLNQGNIESFSEEKLDKIRETYDQISTEAPSVSDRAWKKAQKHL